MNSAFVGYKELCTSRKVLSTSADSTLLDLHNSSYPTQPHSLIANMVKRVCIRSVTLAERSKDFVMTLFLYSNFRL